MRAGSFRFVSFVESKSSRVLCFALALVVMMTKFRDACGRTFYREKCACNERETLGPLRCCWNLNKWLLMTVSDARTFFPTQKLLTSWRQHQLTGRGDIFVASFSLFSPLRVKLRSWGGWQLSRYCSVSGCRLDPAMLHYQTRSSRINRAKCEGLMESLSHCDTFSRSSALDQWVCDCALVGRSD